MKRRIFHVLAGLSLITLFACLANWQPRSNFFAGFRCEIPLTINQPPTQTEKYSPDYDPGFLIMRWYYGLAGFEFERMDNVHFDHRGKDSRSRSSTLQLTIPYWFVTLLAAWVLVTWTSSEVTRFIHTKRRVKGVCEYCSYDLRATPERCPECGATPRQTTT